MKTFNKLMILIAVLFTCNNFAQFSYKNKNDFLTNNNLLDSNKMNLQNEVFILKSLKIFSSFEIKNQNTSKKMDSLVSNFSPIYNSSSKMIFEYNDINQLSTIYRYSLNNKEWDLFERINNTFGYLGKITERKTDEFNNGNWENDLQEIFEYDDAGNEVFHLTQSWEDNNWVNWYKSISYYDTLGNDTGGLSYTWVDSLWEFSSKSELKYNINNQVDEVIVYGFDKHWEKSFFTKYHYDNHGKLDSIISQRWNGNYWVNSIKIYYDTLKYGQLVNENIDFWYNNQWLKYTRTIYNYDKDKYFLHGYCEYWQGDRWLPNIDVIHIQNPDGFEIHYLTYELNIYYDQPTPVEEENPSVANEYMLKQNYPNPFNPSTTINYQIKETGNVRIKIFDALGREITTLVNEVKQPGNYSVTFDADNHSSGIYFVRMQANEFSATRKIILAK